MAGMVVLIETDLRLADLLGKKDKQEDGFDTWRKCVTPETPRLEDTSEQIRNNANSNLHKKVDYPV